MDKDQLLSQLNEGRTAAVLLTWIDPIFEEVKVDTINSLKVNFRQGTYTEQVLACHVARLCAIDDLKNRIQGKAKQGDSAAKKLETQGEVYLGDIQDD